MDEERSFGIIPFQKIDDQWYALLVQHAHGHWAFPKGRIEPGEAPLQCAKRELFEETNLEVIRLLSDTAFEEEYTLTRNSRPAHKRVTYYAAEVQGDPIFQPGELLAFRWHLLPAVLHHLTFPQARSLFQQVMADPDVNKSLA